MEPSAVGEDPPPELSDDGRRILSRKEKDQTQPVGEERRELDPRSNNSESREKQYGAKTIQDVVGETKIKKNCRFTLARSLKGNSGKMERAFARQVKKRGRPAIVTHLSDREILSSLSSFLDCPCMKDSGESQRVAARPGNQGSSRPSESNVLLAT